MNKKNEQYVVVAGLGRSGSSIARFLKLKGEKVIATDINPLKSYMAAELESSGIITEIGFHSTETFENAKKIIVSPGIPLNSKYLRIAAKKGVPVTGELDLTAEFIDIPIIAITGTNGKTTVTTLISEMLQVSGFRVFTGGNIGTPLVNYLMGDEKADIIVAEVSSFQLDTAKKFSPDVAVLLNISEDHIDRYRDFTAYTESKWSIFAHQQKGSVAIINNGIKGVEKRVENLKSMPVFFTMQGLKKGCKGAIIKHDKIIIRNNANSPGFNHYLSESLWKNSGDNLNKALDGNLNKDMAVDSFTHTDMTIDILKYGLKGSHNRENIAAASLACLAVGGSIKGVETIVKSFKGLSHRIEYAGTINGVDYIDDSKATNPDAVIKAIECFENNIILILGGRSKKTNFICMKEAVRTRVKKIIILGESKKEINNAFSGICDVLSADSMEQAVDIAVAIALKGDIVLLSPACASFDLYESYAARGNDFVENVKMHMDNI